MHLAPVSLFNGCQLAVSADMAVNALVDVLCTIADPLAQVNQDLKIVRNARELHFVERS